MLRRRIHRGIAVVAIAGLSAATAACPVTVICETEFQSGSGTVMVSADTLSASSGTVICDGKVYGDSVGTDTTMAAGASTVQTIYTIDSVVTDTTP